MNILAAYKLNRWIWKQSVSLYRMHCG